MTRTFAGVVGAGSESVLDALRRTLGDGLAGDLAASGVALAWTGGPLPASHRVALLTGWARGVDSTPDEILAGDAAIAPARLRGTFALAVLDGDRDEGLLAVDHLGAGALFLHESGGRLSFATELAVLLRMLPTRPQPSTRSLAQWLADGYLEAGETLFEGVTRLEGGHLVRIAAGRARIERYWQPAYAEPDPLTFEESAHALREELGRAVAARLPASGDTVAVLMSGGLDSSAVAAVARSIEPSAARLRGLSLVYPEHPEADESALVDEVARALDIDLAQLEMRGADALGSSLDLQAATGVPASTPMSAFMFPLLRVAKGEGIDVVLDGEGGDELFGCSPYLVADLLRRGRIREAKALARALPENVYGAGGLRERGLRGLVPHRLHRLARRALGARRYAPDWLTPESGRSYVEARDEWAWKRRPGPRWWSFQADLLTTWRERLGAHEYLRQRDAVVGIEGRHPLLDDVDLVECVLRLPPEHAFDRELTRPVAREALRGQLPDPVRLRSAKADFSRLLVESIGGVGLPLARELLAGQDGEIATYVQAPYLDRVLSVPAERRNVAWARLVWRLATTEAWLRTQADPDALAPLLAAHEQRLS